MESEAPTAALPLTSLTLSLPPLSLPLPATDAGGRKDFVSTGDF